jgi:hypothetical protein
MKSNSLNTIIFLICIGCVCYYYFSYLPDKKLEKEFKYSIATIFNFDFPADGGEVAEIKYFINNTTYKGVVNMTYDDKVNFKIGTRFFIKYYPKDPNIFTLISDIKISDTITHIPINGWDSIPK